MNQAALAHLGERQTEVHLSPALHAISGGTVFDPQKRQFLLPFRRLWEQDCSSVLFGDEFWGVDCPDGNRKRTL